MTTTTRNALSWFEIYVADFDRARRFYQTILNETLTEVPMNDGGKMAIFPFDQESGVGGALTSMEGCTPGGSGTIVYLNVEGQLDTVVSRVAEAGGKVLRERMPIPPHGFIAFIQDTEGNSVGLHSMT